MRCAADERRAREQLCRYITRPALANERVQTNAAGQVVLKLKTSWHDGTTHLVMSPLALMPCSAARRPRVALPSAWFLPLKDTFVASIPTTSRPASAHSRQFAASGSSCTRLSLVAHPQHAVLSCVGWQVPVHFGHPPARRSNGWLTRPPSRAHAISLTAPSLKRVLGCRWPRSVDVAQSPIQCSSEQTFPEYWDKSWD